MKTAISIPDPLFDAAEKLAKQLGLSRSKLYQRAVERYVSMYSQKYVSESLDRVYGDDPEISKLDDRDMMLQMTGLVDEEWG